MQQRRLVGLQMTNAVFVHKPDSGYDDQPDRHYHFPKSYLSRVQKTIGDRVVYYGPINSEPGRFYTAVARVLGVRDDQARDGHYYADVVDYIDFDRRVEYRANGGYERKLVMPDGSINGGTAQSAVRLLEPMEFSRIVEAGLESDQDWPQRDAAAGEEQPGPTMAYGFSEDAQPFIERPIVQQLINKKFRDSKFRQHILNVYDRTCAFTGLRLINGGGRPEVEAAHIIPVEENGTDSVRNGISLSGTVHWMFDRGLLSLDDDFAILQSRQLNYDVTHILNRDLRARVPEDPRLQPHPIYLKWHRENRFKH
jgi:putative restriction endonuclease